MTIHGQRNRLGNRRRGQIMVLGALSVLIVALMLLFTLNMGQSVFEKIRIQQVADSVTFSEATIEARAFNYFAYTNRANLSLLVSAVSAHSFMNMATMVVEINMAAALNDFIMAGMEIGECCSCPFCSCVIHCIHAGFDTVDGVMYFIETIDLADKVSDIDDEFEDFVDAINDHMKKITDDQKDVRDTIKLQMPIIGQQIQGEFAPQASLALQIEGINSQEYDHAFEDKQNGDAVKQEKAAFVATEAANGTREGMLLGLLMEGLRLNFNFSAFVLSDTMEDFESDTPIFDTDSSVSLYIGGSKVIENGGSPFQVVSEGGPGPEGKGVGAIDLAMVHSEAYCEESIMFGMSMLGSGENGMHLGLIWPMVCGADHTGKFECLYEAGGDNGCFMLFHSEDDSSRDYGQPKVYAFMNQDLRLDFEGNKGPWELNESGEVKVNLGGDVGEKKMQLSNARGDGLAMSKALVYYHWPHKSTGGWKEHPNFFNPFWRAKLQPFRSSEAQEVLTLAGYPQYAGMILGGIPLP